MSSQVYQLDALFSGKVHGVGFSGRVMALARGFEITGRVRKTDDGRVGVFAEGKAREVMGFIEAVEEDGRSFIRGVETRSGSGPRLHADFSIEA